MSRVDRRVEFYNMYGIIQVRKAMEKREEKRLVREVQAGSQEAFGRLYDIYIDSIFRFVYLKVSSKEDAQDLTSQAFLKLWEGLSGKTTRIKNFRAFLYQIARNLVIDHWRQKGGEVVGKKADVAEMAIIEDESQNLEEKLKLASDVTQVKKALNKVKGDYKDVIIWHYLDELPIAEIAHILGKSRGAVRVMVHRALKEARKWLK